MTDLPEGLSRRARDLAAWFVAADRRTFTPEHLWTAVVAVSPGSSGTGGERRRILVDALRELAAAQVVQLSGTDHLLPALPTRVRLLLRAAPPVRARPEPWHPDMARITGSRSPRPPDTTLGQINQWIFRHRSAAVPEPWRERALDVTGDEKAFDRLDVDPDALESVLVTYRVRVPLDRRQRVGGGPVLLVVENLTTFDSIREVLRAAPGGPIGEILWGAGGDFQSSVLALRDDPPAEIRYFGDLDADGLRIPAAASAAAAREHLPPVRPATGLYAMLLAHGKRRDHVTIAPDRARERASWLDPVHRAAAATLLTGGGRYAQEACRRSLLDAEDTWRHAFEA